MAHNPDKHQRHSIRLKDYDYSQAGVYFITMCTYGKESIFGNVVDGEMQLNECGRVVEEEWMKTAEIRKNVELDVSVVMPNHFHGILVIVDKCRGTVHRAPTLEQFAKPTSGSLPTIVRYFKSAVTRRINELRGAPNMPVWQRNYYEHVIRNENDLDEIREYIVNNTLKWDLDSENPNNAGARCPRPCGSESRLCF
jgi:putative transposase